MQRVYVSSIGIVSCVGNNVKDFWGSLIAGKSGIARLETVDLTDLPITIGGEVRGHDPKRAELNDKVEAKKMDNTSLFAVLAAREAIESAGLTQEHLGDRSGVIIGSGLAGLSTLQKQTENLLSRGPRGVSPFTIPLLMPNAPPANVSLAFGITGPCYNVASACASSGHAIIDAYEVMKRGECDVVITGGSESTLTRLAISAFSNMRAMTKKYNDNPTKASRPFDADRDGFVMSEGACILIFETEEHLRKRGAKPMAEIVGYGSTMDAHHIVQPDVTARGAVRAVRQAMKMAGWDPAAIADETYVNAHGTSTHFNDLMETNAMKEIFGADAAKLRISSTKSITGHMIGAACGIETAACIYAMRDGILPPTINYEKPDPECDLDYIPNEARRAKTRYCINNSFGFGGHNVCIAIAAPESFA